MAGTEKQRSDKEWRPPAATRQRFIAWVEEIGGSREAAALLEVSRSYVDMIKSGDRTPGLRTAYRIEQLTGKRITMQAWVPIEGGRN